VHQSRDERRSEASAPPHLTPAVLATLALLGAVAPLATDTYLPSFPQVASDLHASESSVQLTLTLFMIGMGLGQLFWGPISDRRGRRGLLLWACALFVAASVVAPMSTSIGMLVAMRFLQGFTGAVGPVLGRAVARDLASGLALARAFSLLGIITSLAPIVAPVLGGLLADPIGWRGILWVVAVIAVLMLVSSFTMVPESLPPGRRQPGGLRDIVRSAGDVLTDLPFVGYTLTQSFGIGILFSFISGSSFVLQNEYGLGSTTYALLFALNALALILGGVFNTRFLGRYRPTSLLRIGLIASIIASAATATVTLVTSEPPLWVLLPLIWIASLCNAPIMANTTTLGLQRHARNAGMAAAVMGAIQSALAGLIAQMVSITGSASAVSMTLVMAGSAILAGVAFVALCRRDEVGEQEA